MNTSKMGSSRLPLSLRGFAGVAIVLLMSACSDGSDQELTLFQELVNQGVTRYLGLYSPSSTLQQGNATQHTFGTGDGPLCLLGAPYSMVTRDEGTADLMIFLQGGGACWFDLCAANETAEEQIAPDTLIPAAGILDRDLDINPLAGMSTAYFPYCDGGIFASDADVDSDGDGTDDLFHRGLHNLSAGLDVTVRAFPAPRRIILAGVSGGGYGSLFALPLVRQMYPGIPIEVLNDSGIGITRPADPEFNQALVDYWNISAFFPESCEECIVQGSPAGTLNWQLAQDPDMRLGMLSYAQDAVIGTFFLGLGGPVFESILRTTMADVEAAHPDRMRSFIRAGTSHTFLESDLSISVEGVTVTDWVGAMINGPAEDWNSVSE